MIKNKVAQRGFSVIETLIVIAIVAIISILGYVIYKNQDNTSPDTAKSETSRAVGEKSNNTAQAEKTMTLADGSVTFKTPTAYSVDGVGCVKESDMYQNQTYLDSVAILPGEKLATNYGNGTEFFHINVCVFSNENNLTPKEWFEDASKGGIGQGTSSAQDQASTAKINGYDAFFRKTKQSYEEVNYVISAKGKLVLVSARTYEEDADFKKFESAIERMSKSITVK